MVTRDRPTPDGATPYVPAPMHDEGSGDLLLHAVEEAARLLEADGAMVYLLAEDGSSLRFTHAAGIRDEASRQAVTRLVLPLGTGMFGRAVAERAVVVTDDYPSDPSFRHAPATDRVVGDVGIRSMVVAPLVAGHEVFGALGAFSVRTTAFDAAQIALVRALADHAAAAMANARLIEQLDRSREELRERAEVERSLREIAARISEAADLEAVLQRSVDEAARLLQADSARIDLIDPRLGLLRWAYASGAERPDDEIWPDDPDERLDHGVSGQAVVTGRPYWTGEYLADARFPRGKGSDSYARATGLRSVLAAPLIRESRPFGTLTVMSSRGDAWGEADAAVLAAIADQAAITMTTARLIEELDRSRESLGRRAEAEQALREIAGRLTSIRDPADLLQHVVDEATRLIRADGAILDLYEPSTGIIHWAYESGLSGTFTPEETADLWIELGVGATGRALAEDRVIVAGDDLIDQFPRNEASDLFFGRTGYRSMIAAPITGEAGRLGVLEVFATQPNAFDQADVDLIQGLASQAAVAITNARLIEELARSREEQARAAEAERALREIGARMTVMREQGEILQAINDEAARLLRASGSMINLVGNAGLADAWTHLGEGGGDGTTVQLLDEVELEPDAGVSGLALGTGTTQMSDDYLTDDRFQHTPERDAFVREAGIRSVISCPFKRGDEILGVLTVYADRPGAFGSNDTRILEALADQGAITIMNARLIRALEQSREEVARRADSERTLREIAARVSAILDPAEVLQRIVSEAARLLESDGARIDLFDEDLGALRWAYAAGEAMEDVPDWGAAGGLRPRQAVAGLAFAEQRPIISADYLEDRRFETTPQIEAFVRRAGIRSVVAAPLAGDRGPLGTISVVSRTPAAYAEPDAEILTALATQASIALTNARLMDELARSRAVIERRAASEQALREIAARITAIREPGDLLQHVIDEAARLLRADGALIDLYDPETELLHWAYDAGLPDPEREHVQRTSLKLGEGVSGLAVAERRVIVVDDYLATEWFTHKADTDALADQAGLRSLIAAPIIGEDGPLGVLEVFRREPHAFDEVDAAVLGGLADQAAVAMTNARLIEELARSREEVARRAETERSLRDITARIASIQDPAEVLQRVVEEAKRLLRSDGAHLTRMSEDATYLVPVVVAGPTDSATSAWLKTQEFPLGGGINGLAAVEGRPIWTEDYLEDPRIPHEPDDIVAADRLGLRAMAAAPLRAPHGEVIGTLAISYKVPRTIVPDELDLLQGLADQAAIALTNSNLLARLTESEGRYRYLVQNSPDLVWSIDADARLTFVSDTCERLTGYRPEELLGRHFGALVHESSRDVAEIDWSRTLLLPSQELRGRVDLLRRDGSALPAEFIAMATRGPDGRFLGANGSVRDMSEQVRLERELQDSEARYRTLASSSPDLVFATDADGRYTFLSDRIEDMLGRSPADLIGHAFTDFVAPHALPAALASYRAIVAEPERVHQSRVEFQHADGHTLPLEINVIGALDDGHLRAIHGVARDVRERDRLERDLQESEARFRQLVQTTPDVIWRCDAQGRFTFAADSAIELFGWPPEEMVGRHFSFVTADESIEEAAANWAKLADDPGPTTHHYVLKRRDGSTFRGEIKVIGLLEEGRFVGGQGTVRDVSERERLERELRESEERYRYLVSASPDLVWVTDEQGRLTFVSEASEAILGRQPAELIGRWYWEVFAPSAEREARTRFRWLARHPTAVHRSRIMLRHADGHDVVADINGIGMAGPDGGFIGAHGAARDVSERERLERDLRRQAGELASSEERAHLARELHDSVTQALFSMTLVARSVELLLDRDIDGARAQLAQLRELQREALAEMRALIFELRPGNLEQDGLIHALRTHSAALQGRIGLPIVVESEVAERLPLEIEEVLYRIAQEALHNVVKHAAARQVRLDIRRGREGVRMRIVDDGKGFDPAAVPDAHLGIAGMRARAAKIGALFDCRSEPGRGTTIEITVPHEVLGSAVATVI